MKFEDLTLDQFQRIAVIEANESDEAKRKVLIVSIVDNVDAKTLPMSQVTSRYKLIEAALKNIPDLPYKDTIRIGKKRYKLTMYSDKLTAGQILEIMSFDFSDSYKALMNAHKMLASMARERKLFRTLKYDGNKHPERAEDFKQCKMGDVWGVVGFFLKASESYLKIMTGYMEAKMKTMAKGLA